MFFFSFLLVLVRVSVCISGVDVHVKSRIKGKENQLGFRGVAYADRSFAYEQRRTLVLSISELWSNNTPTYMVAHVRRAHLTRLAELERNVLGFQATQGTRLPIRQWPALRPIRTNALGRHAERDENSGE